MPQPGALIGFGVVIAAVLLTWGIIALVDYVDDGDSGDGGSSGGSSTPDSSDIQVFVGVVPLVIVCFPLEGS